MGKGDRMIYVYTGTNGSGKSLHVAKDIYGRLSRGGRKGGVISSFKVMTQNIKKMKGKYTYCNIYDMQPEFFTEYAKNNHTFTGNPDKDEGQTLIVIDEAQRIFNPRDYDQRGRRAWLDWFPEHRKEGFTIIIITPFDKMIDKQIRSLFEYEVVHRKANNFGFIGVMLSLIGIKMFFAITYWYGIRQKCGTETVKAKKRYTRIYESMAKADKHSQESVSADGGAESPVGGPATALEVTEENITHSYSLTEKKLIQAS